MDYQTDYHRLLYVLEKVKAACSDKYGVFHAGPTDGTDDDMLCLLQLRRDGLIDLALETSDGTMWRYKGA